MKIYIILFIFVSNTLYAEHIYPFQRELSFQEKSIGKDFYEGRRRNRRRVRLITLYNTYNEEKVITEVPRIEEDCHDDGDRFASWSFSHTYSRSINVGFQLSLLSIFEIGSEGELSRELSITYERWIHAQAGIRAIHTPLIKSQMLKGLIYKEVLNSEGEVINTVELRNNLFQVNLVNPIVSVRRELIEECSSF